jgi:hypothetical protein
MKPAARGQNPCTTFKNTLYNTKGIRINTTKTKRSDNILSNNSYLLTGSIYKRTIY